MILRARYVGRGFHPPLQAAQSPGTSKCSPTGSSLNQILLGCYGDFITYVLLIKSLAIGDWIQFWASPLAPEVSVRAESSNPLIMWLVLPATRSQPLVISGKSLQRHNKRHLYGYCHFGNSTGFRSSVPEIRTKNKHISYLKHSIKIDVILGSERLGRSPSRKEEEPGFKGGPGQPTRSLTGLPDQRISAGPWMNWGNKSV